MGGADQDGDLFGAARQGQDAPLPRVAAAGFFKVALLGITQHIDWQLRAQGVDEGGGVGGVQCHGPLILRGARGCKGKAPERLGECGA